MNFWLKQTKIFAFLSLFFILLFASLIVARAQDSIYRLRTGTKIRLRMETEINSKVSSVNDTFVTKIAAPVKVRERTLIPAGTIVEGRVTRIERADVGGQSGVMEIKFETLRFANGEKREIEGFLVNRLRAKSTRNANIGVVLGATALGAIFGAVSRAENGALLGAGIGAGAGTGVALARRGKNVRIKTDEEFEIELKKDVTLPVTDY